MIECTECDGLGRRRLRQIEWTESTGWIGRWRWLRCVACLGVGLREPPIRERARRRDRETSQRAGARERPWIVKPLSGRRFALDAHLDAPDGLNDSEAAQACFARANTLMPRGILLDTLRKRHGELEYMGLTRGTGVNRPSIFSPYDSEVKVITELGRRVQRLVESGKTWVPPLTE